MAWAITYHALSFIPITLIGVWCLLRAGLSIGELSGAERAAASDAEVGASRSAVSES